MLLTAATPIGPEETAGELSERLAVLGAEVIVDTLARLDTLTPVPQRHEAATLAPRLKKTGRRSRLAAARPRPRRTSSAAATPGRAPRRRPRAAPSPCGARGPWAAPARPARWWRTSARWRSPPARMRCSRWRCSRRAVGPWGGTSSCAVRDSPPATGSRRRERGVRAPARAPRGRRPQARHGPRRGRARAGACRERRGVRRPGARRRAAPPRAAAARRRAGHRAGLRHPALAALPRLDPGPPLAAAAARARRAGAGAAAAHGVSARVSGARPRLRSRERRGEPRPRCSRRGRVRQRGTARLRPPRRRRARAAAAPRCAGGPGHALLVSHVDGRAVGDPLRRGRRRGADAGAERSDRHSPCAPTRSG